MLPRQLLLLCFAMATARAQNTQNNQNANDNNPNNDNEPLTFSQSIRTLSALPSSDFTGSQYTYLTYDGQSTVTATSEIANATETSTGSDTDSQSRRTSTTQTPLTLVGGSTQTTANGTASSTSSSAPPTNTIPCNGHPEFCNRKYSNITHIAAHNSAFDIANNAASNQYFDTETQLNDGVRMIQGQVHWVNETFYMCHTSCDLLNAGTWQSQLEIVANWVARHPYDVVTILVGNSDLRRVPDFVPAIQNSGIQRFLYQPEFVPQRRDQWPTLGEMIISGKRVVLFLDYFANQTAVPYVLDEFTHMWETPFSPTDRAFPCTIGRPPKLNETKAQEEFMYLANHNLNTAVSLGALTGGGGGGDSLLIPNTAQINETNGQFDEYGQLEAMRLNCTRSWERPPNFMIVDYYNYGDPQPGSVFEVAARANGVEYNRQCCGSNTSGAPGAHAGRGSAAALLVACAAAMVFVWG